MKLTEKQKNCPYCHVPYKPFISTGKEIPIDLNDGGPIYTGGIECVGQWANCRNHFGNS